MQITKTHKIIISAVVVVLLVGGYIFFDRRSKAVEVLKTDDSSATTTTNTTTDSNGTATGNIYNIEGSGNYTIEQVYGNEGAGVPQPVPDLNRKVTVSSGVVVAPESSKIAAEKILSLQQSLKVNTADLKAWINLGIYQKMAGDYAGAVLSWKYAGRLSPTDFVSRGNLGNLYGYFLHDSVQAEVYYKEALKLGPTQAYLYIQLAEVYRDVLHDITKAKSIIEQGLSKIPNDKVLLDFQAKLN